METKDTCFCEESFIDRSFLVLEILRAIQAKKADNENRVKETNYFVLKYSKENYEASWSS